ncbi:1-phosphofructokinase [Psychromonas sp. CNPT3]|uniref:1-phosphofructokinase n=1 Tax=Psychromonas sp. CNPT3 TaxID=314282 RepID=UPI00006E9CC2|nr:1-phosphofructokinase [Psychromonas sp. CNPT3]AGH80183.1 1-phosphofructokinase [Psychromonas sp. CNPT3]
MDKIKALKVVTITLNPALDLTGHLTRLNKGAVNNVLKSAFQPAGKGVNVGKVLSELGAKVTLTGFLGMGNDADFCALFKRLGVADEFIRVAGNTRINVKVVEENNCVSDINFPGISIDSDAICQFEKRLQELALSHDVFVLAGSLPPGISAQLCAKWIAQLKAQGKKVFFDSSNATLSAGFKAKPWLVKPNIDELEQYVGHALSSEHSRRHAGQQLLDSSIGNVVISLGAEGLMWLNHEGWLCARAPKMNVVSTVGAGDTLVAALCWGYLNQWSKEKVLRFATALSALAVTQVGVGVQDIKVVVAMSADIVIS